MAGLPNPIDSGFVSGTLPLEVPYATQQVQPFNALAITKDTFITFTMTASAVVVAVATFRILLPDGRITQSSFTITSSSARFGTPFTFPLTNGFLLSAFVFAQSGSNRGACVVSCTLTLGSGGGTFQIARLFSGYLSGFDALSWPPGNFESTSAGAGNIRSITGTTPAAGAEISEVVPSFGRWRLKSFTYTLTTSATVANRDSRFTYDDGVNNLFLIDVGQNQAASLNAKYTWTVGGPPVLNNNGGLVAGVGTDVVLAQFFRMRTNTLNLQAADQYSAPQYEVEEWIVQ